MSSTTSDPLGLLVWYSVDNEATVSYERFKELIKVYSAPLTIMKAPKPENIFRRACESYSAEIPYPSYTDRISMFDKGFEKLLVRRALLVERVKDGVITESKVIAEAVLNKKTKEITWEHDASSYEMSYLGFAEAYITNYMTRHADALHALPIRESIRKAIEGPLFGTPMKLNGGGIYFVPWQFADQVIHIHEVMFHATSLKAVVEFTEMNDTPANNLMVDNYFNSMVFPIWLDLKKRVENICESLSEDQNVLAKDILEVQVELTALKKRYEVYNTDATVVTELIDELNEALERGTDD